ncbi:uncharacterized protein LOC123548860 [Mercenaria mercenaria]|uniref:uncharacterized protein LOC123548860 n=1 Tax=Mercenaria mercenaria TaxID=6596 RepID=UPI00234E6362|nr:uncharacterized protein LOC123548860 [Mercenaria mercenaria]
MITNIQGIPEKQTYKESQLNVRSKRKSSTKGQNSSKINTKAVKISKTDEKCRPVEANNKKAVEIETSSVNCCVTTTVSPSQNGPSSVSPPQCLASTVLTNSSSVTKENVVLKTVSTTQSYAANPTQRIVIPQATILQNPIKNQQALIQGIQKQSLNSGQLNRTEKFILPSGFVKDESTNQMFHTYRFNGHTFAMIDNKLYQIHLKSSDGKTKTVIGAMIPTTASASTANARPGMVNAEITKNSSAVFSSTTAYSTISSVGSVSSNTTVGTAAKVLQKPVTYRFPVNILPSSKPNQSLSLLLISTSPSSAATQSTQMEITMSEPSYNRLWDRKVTSPGFVSGLGTNMVKLPVTFTHTAGFQVGNSTSIPLAVGSLSVTQPVVQRNLPKSPVRNHQVNTCGQLTNYRAISPRTAKSLLTNKTYVITNTSPVHSAKVNVQSPTSIEYCGSVVLSSASNKKLSDTQIQQNFRIVERQVNVLNSKSEGESALVSVPSTVASHELGNSGPSLKVHAIIASNNEIKQGKTIHLESDTIAEKPGNEISHHNVSVRDSSRYALRPKSPAKICSSMDSFIYTAKRKRKGTPLKKAQIEHSSMQPQLQKTGDSLSLVKTSEYLEEKSQDHTALADNSKTFHEKITEPVPFLDYPARIVSTGKSGCSKKLSEIVASPKDKVKSGQNSDTSLGEEKIAEMISFANMLEKINEKGAVNKQPKRKKLFKRRRTDDVKVQEKDSHDISSTDSEHGTDKIVDIVENVKQQDTAIDIVTLNQDEEEKPENKSDFIEGGEEQPATSVSMNKDIEQHKDKNMFNELELLVSKQNSLSESCNESNDSYDSSDLETYEKFVSNRKATSDIMKPKSQLIESYYTSQGMKEMKRCNLEPKHSFPVAGTYVTSENSPKIAELESVTSESSLKTTAGEAGKLNTQSKKTLPETASLNSENSTLTPKIRSGLGPVKVKCSSESDILLQSKPEVTQTSSLTQANQKSFTVGGKQVKRLIKTKFIILKGDICDRWFDIKRKTGFGEMSDPKFIHYLLRSEEERQTKMTQINEAQVQTDNCDSLISGQLQSDNTEIEPTREINCSAAVEVLAVDSGSGYGAVDLNNNSNANCCTVDKIAVSDMEDLEATIVNVTDTPQSSPRLSLASTPEIIFQTCPQDTEFLQNDQFSETTRSIAASQKKLGDERTDIPPSMVASQKAPVMPDHSRKRFAKETDVTDAPVAKKKFTFLSSTTQRQMQWAVSLFREWLREKGEEDIQFECRDSAWLDDKLAKFYTDALSHEGTPYSVIILQTFRRSLSLYLASNSSSQNVRISISQDPEYATSNEVLTDLIFSETRQNTVTVSTVTDNVTYPITEEDMEKLYSTRTLSDDDPTCLMWKVWFDITFHLCKGKLPRNFWRSLTKRSLVLESDVNGVFYSFADYVYSPPDEEPGRMYATPNEPEKCPVRSMSFYLSKLCANCEALFQCSKRSWHKLQDRWYLPVPVSREKLDKVMSKVSEHAQLSRTYDASSVILTAKLRSIKKE